MSTVPEEIDYACSLGFVHIEHTAAAEEFRQRVTMGRKFYWIEMFDRLAPEQGWLFWEATYPGENNFFSVQTKARKRARAVGDAFGASMITRTVYWAPRPSRSH